MTFERLQAASNSLPWQALFYINDCQTQLDLGSNDGRTLRGLETPHVTCVELFKPSVRALKQAGFDEVLCEHIQEAVNRFVQEGRQFERVSCFDVIEHLPKADGEKLLDGIEQIAGREIVLFIPIETPEMHADLAFQAHREFGLSQHPAGQRQLQAHLSFWTPDDLAKRGYVIFEMVNFHGEGQNAFFAAKYANDGDANVAMKRVRAHVDGAHIDRPLMLAGPQHMQFGKAVSIGYGARLECITNYQGTGYTPKLSVGDGTTAEMFLHIGCADRVSIGRDVKIGGHVTIVDDDHGKIGRASCRERA